MQEIRQQFIDGAWRPSNATHGLDVIDPYRETKIATLTVGSPQDVDAAVQAARRALPAWQRLSGEARGRYLDALADGLFARRDALCRSISRNGGKPLAESQLDVDDAVACYRHYATVARQLDARQGESSNATVTGVHVRRYWDPIGVVGLITPWNFPLVTAAWKIAPALTAGCSIVFKPSEVVPLPEQAIAEIAQEIGLPPGVFNLINGDGAHAGTALTQHPGIDKLSFTGSTATGESVMRAAATGVRNVSLELGGKSAIIVTEDADLAQAAGLVLNGIVANAGQMCSATSRLLVHQALAEPLYAALSRHIEALVMGDPQDDSTTLGPLVSARQRETVGRYLAQAEHEGLRAVSGTRPRQAPGQGYFVTPRLFRDVPVDSRLWREEIFGPVLCARSFASDEEAIAVANDSDFALAASVVSGSRDRAAAIAQQLVAGTVWTNMDQVAPPSLAWGGGRKSGIGRELGQEGLAAYQELKQVMTPMP
ncbi:aldehyde dehydrogenase family protein [Salinicola avicenniae]|uniref:aldehyde dehydrogenase family protein n=1 Tax=Salinicola avicenniae TaxID=2916836 RepID=UPI002073BC7A|nr:MULTISPECIES: aldehyde dehydrogenase family protein [unclassified Salinicola]